MNRRKFIIGCGSATVLSVAGCLEMAGLSKHESTPGSVDGETLAATGYGEVRMEAMEMKQEFTVEGHTEEVAVVNHKTEYEKVIAHSGMRMKFSVFTSPNFSIAGTSVNPLDGMDTGEIFDRALSDTSGITDIKHDEEEAILMLGEATKSVRYTAKAVAGDTVVNMYLRITEAVPTENGDLLTTIAAYPQVSAEDQNAIVLAENALASYE